MTNEITQGDRETEEPWYHGVKWRQEVTFQRSHLFIMPSDNSGAICELNLINREHEAVQMEEADAPGNG